MVGLIRKRLVAAQDRKKKYADQTRKDREYEVGDLVLLKIKLDTERKILLIRDREDTGNEPLGRGTEIRLHLREEAGEYLEQSKLKVGSSPSYKVEKKLGKGGFGQVYIVLVCVGVPSLKRGELEAACEDFSNVIDTSSRGTVYKGTLSTGIEIAVTSLVVESAKEWP
ncbi:hypothetical protein AgCh_009988 [Apium graveolens]